MKKFLTTSLFLLLALGVYFGIKYPAPTAMPKVLTQAEVASQIKAAVSGLTVQQAPASPSLTAPSPQMAGATIPVSVALFETSLATKITAAATSMTLISGVDKAGTSLSGYMCFTIDEVRPRQNLCAGRLLGQPFLAWCGELVLLPAQVPWWP